MGREKKRQTPPRPQGRRSAGGMLLRALFSLLLLAALLFVVYRILVMLGYANMSVEELREAVAAAGPFGAAIFILITFLQVVAVPLPFTVTVLAGNLLFGPGLSFLYSLVGSLAGSFTAYFLCRLIGRPLAVWIVGSKETVDYYLAKVNGKEFVVFFFMFLLPFFPDDALCAIAGVTDLKRRQFVFIQLFTRPIGIASTLFFMTGHVIPYHGWGIPVWILLLLVSLFAFLYCFRRAEQINRLFDRATDRLAALLFPRGKGRSADRRTDDTDNTDNTDNTDSKIEKKEKP